MSDSSSSRDKGELMWRAIRYNLIDSDEYTVTSDSNNSSCDSLTGSSSPVLNRAHMLHNLCQALKFKREQQGKRQSYCDLN